MPPSGAPSNCYRPARRWPWFAAWAIPGACFGMAVSVVGLLTIPAGMVGALALRGRSAGREMLGLLAGIGIATTVIGSLHADYRACSATRGVLVLRPGQTSVSFSCGGVDGAHWVIVGIALIVAAVTAYHYAAHRASRSSATSRASTP